MDFALSRLLRSYSSEQHDEEDDEQDRAKPTTDIRASEIESTTAEKNEQDDKQEYEVHRSLFQDSSEQWISSL